MSRQVAQPAAQLSMLHCEVWMVCFVCDDEPIVYVL